MSPSPRRNFTSDNVTGTAPEIMAAIAAANEGQAPSYGGDPYTQQLTQRAREIFECDLTILPVATGTAANALALAVLAQPYGAIYCHETAHVMTDECGAPEFYTGGTKLMGLPGPAGKITPQQIAASVAYAESMGVHHVPPCAVTLSQATEWGAVYRLDEVEALCATAHHHGLPVHMDGARFANALVHLGCSPAEATWKRGIDVLSLGATKNGALAAEAVVLFNPKLEDALAFRRKRGGHLLSKMRFFSAQLLAYLEDDLWLIHARNANTLATRLATRLTGLGGRLVAPVEANEVFIALPESVVTRLRSAGYDFYDWPPPRGEAQPIIRLVTAYDMTHDDVDALARTAGAQVNG
jgi:threonine aldolase